NGSLINQGRISASANVGLAFGGIYDENGGTIDGDVAFYGSQIKVTAAPATGTTIVLRGNNTLLTNNLAGITLWVQGSNAGGHAQLTIAGDLTNTGILLMQSINDTWRSNIAVADGVTLTNVPGGFIQANPGSGGGRTVNGSL